MSAATALERSRALRVLPARADDVGRVAASVVASFVRESPSGVLGVATGGSPLALYSALADLRAEGLVATDGLTLAALDEYVGLDPADPRSYRSYVREHVARPLGIAPERVHVPVGSTSADAGAYERLLARLGVGLQIVGIGRNGHIGFNEPGSDIGSRTRVVTLDADTRRANASYFGGDADAVPAHAMTQGIASILSARSIVLVAQGAAKAMALRAALDGPVTPEVPALFLQTHPDVTVVADGAALGTSS